MKTRKPAKVGKRDRKLLRIINGIETLRLAAASIQHCLTAEGVIFTVTQMEEDCRTLETQIKDLRAACVENH